MAGILLIRRHVPSRREAPLVLIVDDLEDAREMCVHLLALYNYRTATADDGFEALLTASRLLPDVILMDLSMPWLDGLEATRRLKSDERTRVIPVIAMTAVTHGEAQRKALQAGCAAVIKKPYSAADLEAAIRRQLASRRVDGPAD